MGIASIVETFVGAVGSATKKPLTSFSFLETAEGNCLVAKDGSVASILRIDGIKKLCGEEDLFKIVDDMKNALSSRMEGAGHSIQVWFARDPDRAPEYVHQRLISPRSVAQSIGLQLDDVFEERERMLPKRIVCESFYMVLWTRLSVLTPHDLKAIRADMQAPKMWPASLDTQNFFLVAQRLRLVHQSFVDNFHRELISAELRAQVLNGHEALAAVRASIYPDQFESKWRPSLPGDPLSMTRLPQNNFDLSYLLWPRIDDQLFTGDCERIDNRIARIGNYYFAGTDMQLGPAELQPFDQLLSRMISITEFPWRCSFQIDSNGLAGTGINKLLASVLGMTNSSNRLVREAISALEKHQQDAGITVKLRVSFCTWAPANKVDDLSLIEERLSRLQKAVETWGICQVSNTSGDPVQGTMSSALGLDVTSTAPTGVAPVEDAMLLMPWTRDASPWPDGSVLFRTLDRRPWPYQPGSSLQTGFVDLIAAPPGFGKSVLLNTTNLAFCLSPFTTQGTGGASLPRIAIIDIGDSSAGLVSLLKESLPPSKRHLAESKRLRMEKAHSINPFDLQLGMRKPLPLEKSFLVNFVTAVGTPVGATEPPMMLAELASMAIDELYDKFSDQSRTGQPKVYSQFEDQVIDDAIKKFDIEIAPRQSWWGLVDKFFDVGTQEAIAMAVRAQRYAVPLLDDLLAVNSPQIQNQYGAIKTNDQPLLKVFETMIAAAIRDYPILTSPTRFDVGNAQVVSLNLDEACPRGGGAALKQTGIVYMLARFVLAKDFYLDREYVEKFPERYQNYQRRRIERLRELPKKLVFDEYHRTKPIPPVRAQTLIDAREGRKFNVHVSIASQLIDDFEQDLIELTNGVWLLGTNSGASVNRARTLFNLSDTATRVLSNDLTGPGPEGAPFLLVLSMKDGKHEHLLMNSLGPVEIWAFTTTAEDTALRSRLYQTLGPLEARRRLAKRFPNGSAKPEIERRTVLLAESGQLGKDSEDGIVAQLADEIVRGVGL